MENYHVLETDENLKVTMAVYNDLYEQLIRNGADPITLNELIKTVQRVQWAKLENILNLWRG